MRKTCALLALCLLLAVPGLAQAALVTYDFSGTITSAQGVAGVGMGQVYTGSFSYDPGTYLGSYTWSNTYDTPPNIDKLLTYDTPPFTERIDKHSAAPTYQVTSGGVTVATRFIDSPTSIRMEVSTRTYPGYAPMTSQYYYNADNRLAPSWEASSTQKELFMLRLSTLSSTQPADLGFCYYAYNGGDVVNLAGTIDSFSERTQPTPLPAAAWLLGSGLVGLAGLRKRYMKS